MIFGYNWEWWLTEAAPGLGAFASLILVLYYARLYRETREQTKATQASYAPSLDTKFEIEDNELFLTIANRGEGSAKNISLEVEVTANKETTGYLADFQTTLQPGMALATDDDAIVRLKPIVYDVTDEDLPDTYLISYISGLSGAFVTVNLRYTDVIEQQEFKDHLANSSFRVYGDSLEEILPFPSPSYFWATGPDIGLFGPKHIEFQERVDLIWNEWKRGFRTRLRNLRREGSFKETYMGPVFREEIYAQSIDVSDIDLSREFPEPDSEESEE
ncbi:hypothetical protein [Halostagnicola sp. A56]|uniref:hypothetical protein n=1 Tax=Halostagnicola sp. A56 TaxID=1495067 RepID=UPI00049F89F1|nr:hypothetical protein [Halostagnicola sp. A56]